jgi:hypothetical protein
MWNVQNRTTLAMPGNPMGMVTQRTFIGWTQHPKLRLSARERLNPGLIPVKHPGELTGDQYSFEDTQVISGRTYTYWVEAVKQIGPAELSSPQMVLIGYNLYPPTIQRR